MDLLRAGAQSVKPAAGEALPGWRVARRQAGVGRSQRPQMRFESTASSPIFVCATLRRSASQSGATGEEKVGSQSPRSVAKRLRASREVRPTSLA